MSKGLGHQWLTAARKLDNEGVAVLFINLGTKSPVLDLSLRFLAEGSWWALGHAHVSNIVSMNTWV
jgi:hypothetical protein